MVKNIAVVDTTTKNIRLAKVSGHLENAFNVNVLKANNCAIYAYSDSNAASFAQNNHIPYRPIKLVDNIIFAYDDNSKTADIIRTAFAKVEDGGCLLCETAVDEDVDAVLPEDVSRRVYRHGKIKITLFRKG